MPQLVQPEGVLAVPGFRAMGVHAGLKKERPDVGLIVCDGPSPAGAAVFTQNAFAAAPVHVSRQHVANGDVRAIVVNSGNANACTGRQGLRDALGMARLTAQELGIQPEQVVVCSTGIIGRPMPMDKIKQGIHLCAASLDDAAGGEIAQAIMTTDSGPKQALEHVEAGERRFTVAGIAKGAGMIHPNMATMLGFLVTDAPVEPVHLRAALKEATEASFNQISVDGDESTNDTAVLLASGAEGGTPISPTSPEWPAFQEALRSVCQKLAKSIAADGEGATRMFEVEVQGAASVADARVASRAVAKSNLVKAAIHGQDPNWGRIVAAVGSTRVILDEAAVSLDIEASGRRTRVLSHGTPIAEALPEASEILAAPEVRLVLHLGAGEHHATAWGCDLTEEYVSFNSQYST